MAIPSQSTQTILIDASLFSTLVSLYQDHQLSNPTEYVVFFSKNDLFTVTVYPFKDDQYKVVFQGQGFLDDLKLFQSSSSKDASFIDHYGSDEVGTGDFFGPIVVTASYVNASLAKTLVQLGVKDSKELTDDEMKLIVLQLEKQVTSVSTIVHPEKYKKLIDEGFNLNAIKAKMHHHALTSLLTKVNIDAPVIIDQFASKKNMDIYLHGLKKIQHLQLHEKAENKYLAVALSSIIARVKFLDLIDTLSSTYQTKIPLGANPHVERFALSFAKKHGIETLKKITKSNFKTLTRIIEALSS